MQAEREVAKDKEEALSHLKAELELVKKDIQLFLPEPLRDSRLDEQIMQTEIGNFLERVELSNAIIPKGSFLESHY